MPKHGKGKRFQQAKRNQPVQRQPAAVSQTQPVSAAPKPVASSISPAAVKTAVDAASLSPQSMYITSELKRIGILTGIIIIVLVVLAIVLT
jgi:hypothetical protein